MTQVTLRILKVHSNRRTLSYLAFLGLLGIISFMIAQGNWQYAAVLMVLPLACVVFNRPEIIGAVALIWPIAQALESPRYETIYPALPRFLPDILWRYMDELLCYGFFAVVLVQRIQNKQPLRMKRFLWAILVFCLFAFLSAMYNEVENKRQALLITSTYMKPWLLFYAVANLTNARRFAVGVWKGMVGYAVLNMPVVLLQYMHTGMTGDGLFGLTVNCNAMAIIMFDVSLVLLIDFFLRRDWKKWIASFLFAAVGILGSWLVATFSLLLIMGIGSFMIAGSKKHNLIFRVVLVAVILGLGLGIVLRLDKAFVRTVPERLQRGTKVGMIQAYPALLKAGLDRPLNLLLGFGQGRYGSTYAQSLAFEERGAPLTYSLISLKSDETVRRFTNSITGLAGDFGVVACAMVIGSMLMLSLKGIKAYKLWVLKGKPTITQEEVLLIGFALVMPFHLLVSTLYPWQTLDNPFFMFPQLAILGGLLGHRTVKEGKSGPTTVRY